VTNALGLDLGGTGLRAYLANQPEPLAQLAAAPSSSDRMGDTLKLVAQFASETELRFDSVCIGMSGFSSLGVDPEQLANELNALLGAKNVLMTSDMVSGHYSHFEESPGATLIAGTGALAFGVGPLDIVRIDGLGATVGDFGSGYWIGREAIRLSRRTEELNGNDQLLSALETAIGPASGWPLSFGRGELSTADVAKLAPIVFSQAEQGSELAESIVLRASKLLVESAKAAATKSGSNTVAFGGGLFAASEKLLAESVEAGILRANLEAQRMTAHPGEGAASLAAAVDSKLITQLISARHLVRKQF